MLNIHNMEKQKGVTLRRNDSYVDKKPKDSWLSYHFSFMFWSVMGLYAAFLAEILTRLPNYVDENIVSSATFYSMTGIAVFIVMGIAKVLFRKYKKKWSKIEHS